MCRNYMLYNYMHMKIRHAYLIFVYACRVCVAKGSSNWHDHWSKRSWHKMIDDLDINYSMVINDLSPDCLWSLITELSSGHSLRSFHLTIWADYYWNGRQGKWTVYLKILLFLCCGWGICLKRWWVDWEGFRHICPLRYLIMPHRHERLHML